MKRKNLCWLILILISFGLYVNTIPNEFALDDKMVIQNNVYTQKGIEGIGDILTHDMMAGMFGEDASIVQGGRYRPLSMVIFAIGQSVFDGNPHVMHFFNVLFYVLSVLLLYKVMVKFFPPEKGKNPLLSLAFIATLLYAAHPIHTEIVANIKGRDEILAFLGAFAALWFAIRYAETHKPVNLFWIFLVFFLGMMSKEIAFTFLFVIPFSLWFFNLAKKRDIWITLLPALGAAALYLIVRVSVLGQLMGEPSGQLMNNPFLEAEVGEKYATIFYTLGLYLKLLIIPHPLTWDYYPHHIQLIDWSNWKAILPLIIYASLGVLALVGLKKRRLYAWAILFFFATLSMTSNLVINIGVFMSERFMFFPSVTFAVILAFFLLKLLKVKHGKKLFTYVVVIIVGLYAVKAVSRNVVWKNSFTLFGHDVQISKNSAKGNSSYGSELYSKAEKLKDTGKRNEMMKEAIPYFKRAMEIHPNYIEPMVRMANIRYVVFKDVKGMVDLYIRVLKIAPENQDALGNIYGVLTQNIDKPVYEIKTWKRIAEINPNHPELWEAMGDLYLNKRYKPDSAIMMFEKAEKLSPNDAEVLRKLGFAYGTMHRPVKARQYFEKLLKIKPNDAEALKFIGISYGIEGKDEKAVEYLERSLAINPQDEQARTNMEIAKRRLQRQN
ncbi:MAG: glycosyltransferase family 39 protein [Candidatus Delongbacteria bacterium]|jgi:tetratricopeptide (TPR) repeat protein|nr:glycosyltransferase family 39 protein [Candidatus Delongbacteria bacterium]